MSKGRGLGRTARRPRAPVFAALGDETRLALVARLSGGESYSISQLAEYCANQSGSAGLTRQAVTKHLRVLEDVGIVRCARRGRETVFVFQPEPVEEMREVLEFISHRWDEALGRLKKFVEQSD